jgi:hypothetical protein
MSKHSLARAGGGLMPYRPVDKDDPKTQRKARRETATDENSLDKRRLAYQHEGMELRAIQTTMMELRAESLKLSDAIRELEARNDKVTDSNHAAGVLAIEKLRQQRQEKDDLYTDCYNMASLKGLTLLFEGQSLMIDMLSVEQYEMNRETDKREYWRVSVADVAFDMIRGFDLMLSRVTRLTRMVNEVGMKSKFWHQGQFLPLKDGVEVDDDEEGEEQEPEKPTELEKPVGAGVPEEDLKVSKMSRDKVIQMVRGTSKEKEPGAQ